MPRHTFDLTIETDCQTREFRVTAEYDYHREYIDRFRETPDEPAHVEIGRVMAVPLVSKGNGVWEPVPGVEHDVKALLNIETLADAILAEHEGEIEAARENYFETRREQLREDREAAE